MEMDAAAYADNGELLVKDQVLDCLFRAAQVDGGLFHVEKGWLDDRRGDVGEFRLEQAQDLSGDRLHEF